MANNWTLEVMLMGFDVSSGGFIPVRHIHPNQYEYFEVELELYAGD